MRAGRVSQLDQQPAQRQPQTRVVGLLLDLSPQLRGARLSALHVAAQARRPALRGRVEGVEQEGIFKGLQRAFFVAAQQANRAELSECIWEA